MGIQGTRFLESKYAFLVVVAIFVFVLLILTMVYFKSGPAGREIITKGMTLFGNAVMILNLLILIYTKLLERIKEQKDQVSKINDFSMTAINTIFSQFYKEKDNLGDLYGEIFEDKIDAKKPVELDYYETNFLFIVFQIIHNVYRSYYISGADTNKYDVSQYDSWENLILQIVKSPKVQLFYKRYSHLFVSLGFNDYIEKQYFNRVPRYIDINAGLAKTL